MKVFFLFITLFQLSSFIGFSQVKEVSSKSALSTRNTIPGKIQYGTASFYADKFEGKKTANGDIFSQKRMTAAHNTLPLGTWIRVTNLSNHKSVVVRVNDRLHKKNPRLVDLSKKAAKELGYVNRGLTKVRVDVLDKYQQSLAIN